MIGGRLGWSGEGCDGGNKGIWLRALPRSISGLLACDIGDRWYIQHLTFQGR